MSNPTQIPPLDPSDLDLDLEELWRLHELATPQDWEIEMADWQAMVIQKGAKGPKRILARVGGSSALGHNGTVDSNFIVVARSAIPSLIRRLVHAERELEELKAEMRNQAGKARWHDAD